MQSFSGDCGGGASVAEVDGRAWCVGVGGVTQTELTKIVSPPAADGAVVEECARVISASGDCSGDASVAEVDGRCWCVGVGGVAVAELPSEVISPASDLTVVKECARVISASGDGGSGAARPEVDGRAWSVGLGSCPVTKLTSVVISPTLSAAVGQQSTSVISPTADLNRVVRVCSSDCRT